MWFSDIVRLLFFGLDKILYFFVDKIYNLFFEIANTTIFTDEIINAFVGKVYSLVGIFMLFKVSFSILTYIVNPDEFNDKSKGMSKLSSNIVISLVLLILVPKIFTEAMDFQRLVLRDDVIPKILSTELENGNKISINSQNPNQGSQIAFESFKAFYNPPGSINSLDDIFNTDVTAKEGDKYLVDYDFGISTLVGIALNWILILFCFDIAVRSVKLGVLRILAPIPIVSRVDPKKGNDIFNKWVKNCVSTYLDLFMRLVAIFFAIYMIKALEQGIFVDAVTGNYQTIGPLTKVFIILGVLMFAKQLPSLIEDLLGIKLSGNFTWSPSKKLASVPLAGRLASTGIGALDSWANGNGFMAGARRNWNNVSWGGDNKRGVLDTADHRMRKEIKEKQDYAKKRYESQEAQRQLDTLYDSGEEYFNRINAAEFAIESKARRAGENLGLKGADLESYITQEKANHKQEIALAKEQAEKKLYGEEYYKSKKKVDEAKAKMYAWDNYVTRAQEEYSHALNYGTEEEKEKTFAKYESAKKNYGSAKGQYERMQKEHENYKGSHVAQAKIEDSVEAYEKMGGKSIDNPPKYSDTSSSSQTTSGTSTATNSSTTTSETSSTTYGGYSPETSNSNQDYYEETTYFDDALRQMMAAQSAVEDEKYMNEDYDAYSYNDAYMGTSPNSNTNDDGPTYLDQYYDDEN